LAVLALLMFFMPGYEAEGNIRSMSVSGRITLQDRPSAEGLEVYNKLAFSTTPPSEKHPHGDANTFLISHIPIGGDGRENIVIRISKEGYYDKYVTIKEAEKASAEAPYVIRKEGSLFTIDAKTPIVLEPSPAESRAAEVIPIGLNIQ